MSTLRFLADGSCDFAIVHALRGRLRRLHHTYVRKKGADLICRRAACLNKRVFQFTRFHPGLSIREITYFLGWSPTRCKPLCPF